MPTPVIDIPGTLANSWNDLITLLQAGGYDVIEFQGGLADITTREALIQYLANYGIRPVYTISETLTGFAQVMPSDPANTTAVTVGTGTAVTAVQGVAQDFTMNGGSAWGIVKKGIAITAALALMISTLDATLLTDLFRDELDETATPFTIDGENIPVQISSDGKTYYNVNFLEAIREKLIELGVFNTGETTVETAPVNFPSIAPIQYPVKVVTPGVYHWQVNYRQYYANLNLEDGYAVICVDVNGSTTVIIVSTNENHTVRYGFSTGATQVTPTANTVGYTATFSFDGKTAYSTYVSYGGYGLLDDLGTPLNTFTGSFNVTVETQRLGWLARYASEGGTAVEGVEPKESLLINGISDLTKKIYEVIPDWGNPVSTATPTDEDLTEQTDWYPVNTNDVDGLTDGLTEDQTEDATDGVPDDDSKDEIIEQLQELINILLRDPDTPDDPVIPVIEVGDSGDTPPAEPPLLSGSSNGLWAIYNPTLQNVHDFGAWLWSDNIIDQITRQFKNSPIDAVIGFHMIYCTPITGASKIIKAGYLDSPVSAPEVTNQYVTINCGTVNVSEYYGNALDYMQTSISLYLPFIGIVPLAASVVMGSQVQVIYRIDVLTGTCLAQVKVIKENSSAVLYTYQGNCSVQIPLTGATYTGMVGALMGAVSTGISVMAGNLAGAASGIRGTISAASQGANIQKSGTLGSNAGALGIRIPYMIITHPVARMPYEFQNQEGIPSNNYVNLGACAGFTRVKTAHVENINNATADELIMIRDTLYEGILI